MSFCCSAKCVYSRSGQRNCHSSLPSADRDTADKQQGALTMLLLMLLILVIKDSVPLTLYLSIIRQEERSLTTPVFQHSNYSSCFFKRG